MKHIHFVSCRGFYFETSYIFQRYLIKFLYTFKDDPKECKMVDCTKELAGKLCPKTCSEPKFCKIVDCTKPKSPEICPRTCAERTKEDIGNKNRLISI